MSFPQIASRHTVGFDSAVASFPVPMPATVNAGDLLIIIFTCRKGLGQADAALTPSGWERKTDPVPISSGARTYVFAKKAAGTEGGTNVDIDLENNFNRRAIANVYRITDWYGEIGGIVGIGAGQPQTSSWNPPPLTAPWGTDDNLWICAAGLSNTNSLTVSSYPADYIDTDLDPSGPSGNTGKVWQAVAVRERAVIEEDPGPFVFDRVIENGGTVTLVVRPVDASEDECEGFEPAAQSVRDEFDGPNDTPLSSHVSDSGHAWIEGHGNPPLSTRRRGFGSFSTPQLYPMVLNGQGALVNPQAWRLRDSRQLVYAPRTNSYEIGACFQRQNLAMPDNSLSFFWRDTSTEYYDGGGKRYELFLLKGGDMVLRKRIGNTITVLDSDTAVFADGENNYLQIIQDGNDISIKLNGSEVLSATDASILEPGTISLSINGRSLLTPYPTGFWRLNWFYVDDSYASFPVANKAVVLTERLRGLESLVKEDLDFDTTHFVNVTDTLTAVDAMEPPDIEEPTTKTVELFEGLSFSDSLAELFREETCGEGSEAFFEVGSFTPQSTTGNQVINHSLGVTPKAIIIWATGKAPGSFGADIFSCIGFSDGTADACVQNTIEDNVGTSDTYRRIDNVLFLKRSVTGALVKSATLSSWDGSTFTINNGSANADAMTVCYLLIGGDGVEAKVGDFNTITTTGGGLPAAQAVTGVGFEPDGILMGYVGGTGTIPQSLNSAALTFGFADAALNAGSVAFVDQDAQAITNNHCGQLNDAVLSDFDIGTGAVTRRAIPASMDSDGFTLTFTSNFNANTPVAYLALKGISIKVGAFNKATGEAPAAQAVTGVGFEPDAVLLMSKQRAAASTSSAGIRMGMGGTDGTNEHASAIQSEDNNTTSQANEICKTDKSFIVCNNDTPAIDAEADLSSFDEDGFTLNWTTNHAEATEILYLAFASAGIAECNKKIIHLADFFFAEDSPSLPAKGVTVSDTARINELPGVSGNSINKVLTIAEFMNTEDIPSSSRELAVSDSFTATEFIGRVFKFLDLLAAQETLDIRAVISLVDTANVTDVAALRIILSLADSMTLTDVLSRYADIKDTAGLLDLINLLRSANPQADFARARDSVTVIKTGAAEYAPPERTFYARDLKRLKVVEKGKHIIR